MMHAEYFLPEPRFWQKKKDKTWASWQTTLQRWYEKYAAYMLSLGGTFDVLSENSK